jgi:sulfur relay (sulfurtransferase) DsrF/TusC family protein
LGKTSTWLFIIGSEPYRHGLPSDPAIDAIMAAGAFGQRASVLFVDDGCKHLSQAVSPPPEQSDLRKLLRSLPLYDVDQLFMTSSAAHADIDFGDLPVTWLEPTTVAKLVNDASHVVTFT